MLKGWGSSIKNICIGTYTSKCRKCGFRPVWPLYPWIEYHLISYPVNFLGLTTAITDRVKEEKGKKRQRPIISLTKRMYHQLSIFVGRKMVPEAYINHICTVRSMCCYTLIFSCLFQNPQMEKHSQRAINHVYVLEGKLAWVDLNPTVVLTVPWLCRDCESGKLVSVWPYHPANYTPPGNRPPVGMGYP